LILGLVLSIAVIVIFCIRILQYTPPQRVAEPIRAWMTLPYIAQAYHVPVSILCQALSVPQQVHDRRPLNQIARQQHLPLSHLIDVLHNAINNYRQLNPLPHTVFLPDKL
jgi:hypothetical protein